MIKTAVFRNPATVKKATCRPSKPQATAWPHRLLILVALLFSWPIFCHSYLLDADDYLLGDKFRSGLGHALADYFTQFGARRLLQMAYMETVCALPMVLINLVCIAVHLTASLLLYEVTVRLFRRPGLALILSLAFAASPLALGVMIWACGSYVALHLAFFLAALLSFFSYAGRRSRHLPATGALAAGCTLTVLCLFSGDHLIPVTPFLGLLVAAAHGIPWRSWLRREHRPLILAPVLTTAAFMVVAVLTCPYGLGSWNSEEAGSIHYDRFNPHAFFSVWFRLYRVFDSLQPWTQSGAMRIAFGDWKLWHGIVLVVLFAALARLLWRAASSRTSAAPPPSRSVLLIMGLMMIAVAAVHALHGGFSGSMRYLYVPFVFVLWVIGWALSTRRFASLWPPHFRVLTFVLGLGLLLFSAITCWLDLGISRFEVRRYQAVVKAIAADPTLTDLSLAFEPPLYYTWPKLNRVRSHGAHELWAINFALSSLGHDPITLSSTPTSPILTVTASPNGQQIHATLLFPLPR